MLFAVTSINYIAAFFAFHVTAMDVFAIAVLDYFRFLRRMTSSTTHRIATIVSLRSYVASSGSKIYVVK